MSTLLYLVKVHYGNTMLPNYIKNKFSATSKVRHFVVLFENNMLYMYETETEESDIPLHSDEVSIVVLPWC